MTSRAEYSWTNRIWYGALLFFIVSGCSSLAVQNENAEPLESMIVDGVEREWRIFVPPSYKAGSAAALVLDFHGTGSAPHLQAGLSGFEELAVEQGFLVASPAAKYARPKDGRLTWNVDLHQHAVDDVRFVRALVGRISDQFTVDPDRIYATGMSGGARMACRLACDLPELIAAIGPVGGIRFPEDCSPARPVPVIAFHGKKDEINHYEDRVDSPAYWRMGVEEAITGWVRNNRCASTPREEAVTPTVTRVSYQGCAQSGDIVFYRSEDAGHTWPGSPVAGFLEEIGLGKTDMDIPATKLIWDFFASHAR